MDTARKLAIAAGTCFLITHVTSVPAGILYGSIVDRTDYVIGSISDNQLLLGAFLEVICALGNIGTSVALFPIVKRWSEAGALGYVGLRTLEAGIIAVGVIPILALVTLQRSTGADGASAALLGNALADFHYSTRLLGPGLVCGANTVLMAFLLYRSRLVPRLIPVLGLVGGPAVFAYHTAHLFGASGPILSWAVLGVIPIFAWEVSLALRLIIKGFSVPAATSEAARRATKELVPAV